ncbi:MAG: sodium:proton antiporter [Candidatus Eisenbacteria bacterium]|uniref:Sodium:proton antiporter n=1 Tax=Eiseniibacteriota bacterium TaxID=2212470 RepID=A0A948RWA6_UNCEI|nr:sodium:proton antiporter [Candidatus Eisenbacteria bacterium]MBU1947468.1 sodium:proton antiporter [Candidatus Eisenbacteria bacterium]MBU2690839.1 sodium:proton antiporter [Candidatus Eisenbacteria bacterium]
MIKRTDSIIVAVMARALVPLIQLYALYVHFHGHSSPGGGFQGGALLAASILLIRITMSPQSSHEQFPADWGVRMGAIGTLIYAGTGILCLLGGGHFLDYARMIGFSGEAASLRSLGITFIETGVLFAVMGTMVTLFDRIIAEAE